MTTYALDNPVEQLFELAENRKVITVTGKAGTGKTSLIRKVADALAAKDIGYVVLCPTGKAARRCRDVVGIGKTIHSGLYGTVEEAGPDAKNKESLVFGDPHSPCGPGEWVLVDEASMIDKVLAADLIKYLPQDSKIIYFGDYNQLPPVNGSAGVDLESADLRLTTVHRQGAGSDILSAADQLLAGVHPGAVTVESSAGQINGFHRHRQSTLAQAVTWYRAVRDAGWVSDDFMFLCWSNKLSMQFATQYRAACGRIDPLVPGDMLVARGTNKRAGVLNGDLYTVMAVQSSRHGPMFVEAVVADRSKPILVNTAFLGDPDITKNFQPWYRSLPMFSPLRQTACVRYGDAVTVHSFQGSQTKYAGILWDGTANFLWNKDRAEGSRWAYTAATRASLGTTFWMVP